MRTKAKNTIAADRWKREIAPVTAFADEHHGFKAALADRLGARLKDKKRTWRVMLDSWVTSNDERRVQPAAGTGLILIAEAKKVMAEWESVAAA